MKQITVLDYYSRNMSYIGPSGVRALPLAAGINVGGHYIFSVLLTAVVKTQ